MKEGSPTHFDEQGKVRMVDVSEKPDTVRIATARGRIEMAPSTCRMIAADVEVGFDVRADDGVIEIEATAKCVGKTGVEMEALTAVAVAALTIYDMAKAIERTIRITDIRLVRKSGGKSGEIVLEEDT